MLKQMIAAFDVHYGENDVASAAAVIFQDYGDRTPAETLTRRIYGVADYTPGAFYRRELPCLLELVKRIKIPLTGMIIDGYVTLGDRPGLGMHLYNTLGGGIPVIGVAKNRYAGTKGVEVLRGNSRKPLIITSIGIGPAEAAARIKGMHGQYRIPTLLKLADQLARELLPVPPH